MKLMVQSYNNGTSSYNAETEETELLSYTTESDITNPPAIATIILADPTGSIAQKYNADANDVYIGVGRATIEDPDVTDLFYGRIVSAKPNPSTYRTTLIVEDWMCQLDDEMIDYDMREDLDGAGLRESTTKTHTTSAVYVGPVYTSGANYYLFDDDMAWADDTWNGYYLILLSAITKQTFATGPYDETTVAVGGDATLDTDTPANGEVNLWEDDTDRHLMEDNDDTSFTVTYYFRTDATLGSLHSDLLGIKLIIVYKIENDKDDTDFLPMLELWDNTGIVSAAFSRLNKDGELQKLTLTVPDSKIDSVLDANGECEVDITVWVDTVTPSIAKLNVYTILLELEVENSGHSSAISITDTFNPNRIKVGTDLSATGLGLWENCPYSIAREIHYRINDIITATIDGVNPDNQVTLTTSVESTSGISTDKFEQKTRLTILKELAKRDGAVVWLPLASTVVQYKKTTDAAATAITDADVSRWITSGYDFSQVKNKYTVYGVRIGDEQIVQTDSDATSIAKFKTTRNEMISTRALSDYEAKSIATALVARNKDLDFSLKFEVSGLSSYRPADYLQVTSALLNISAVNYTVVKWKYDSKRYVTTIELEQSVTTGYSERPKNATQAVIKLIDGDKATRGDKFVPYPSSDVT